MRQIEWLLRKKLDFNECQIKEFKLLLAMLQNPNAEDLSNRYIEEILIGTFEERPEDTD